MTKWTDEQRDAIYKDGTNIIVSAGAGSGKTAVLSERVIEKLKKGVNINEMLILTFTKAAAFEMKERIRSKIINEDLKDQLDLIDTAYITTFDSFALSIVKKYHYLYNIDSNVSISDNNIIALETRRILDDIFKELYLKQEEKFKKLLKDFATKNDKEIKNMILKINSKLDMKVDKQKYLDDYISNYYDENFINQNMDEYINILLSRIETIGNLLDFIKTYSDGDYYEKAIDILSPLLNSKNYDEIKSNANISLPRLPDRSSDELKNIKTLIANILKEISDYTKYENILEIKEEYLETLDYVEVIIKIIKELDSRISEYKKANDLYEFNDIAIKAINIIKNNSKIKEEIKNSFKEIMIDEYQDTNDLQECFISLIANNNTYSVGDIKQSIYRFRNANPFNFKDKYDRYKNNIDGYKIDLNKNFRSRKEILNDINKIFNLIMSDNIGASDYLKEHQMVFGNLDYDINKSSQKYGLQIYNYEKLKEYNNDEIEAFIIADDIKNKLENKYQIYDKDLNILRDVTLNDFVILIDRSSSFDTYKKIFEYLNIPTSVEKDEDITEETEIIVIKNLLNLIIKIKKEEFDTEFKYYFTSIARSFLLNYDDNVIFEYFKNNNFKDDELYKKAYKISLKIDNLSIDTILNYVIKEFDIYYNLIKIGKIEERTIRIDYLFNIASNLSKLGFNIYKYVEHITEIINGNDQIKFSLNLKQDETVRITTIHKSKGLEYSICYFPGFDKKFNMDDLKEKFIYDNKYGIIAPYFKEGIGATFYKELYRNKYILEEISEKIRLFYVALTRARENMIIVTELKENHLAVKNKYGLIDDNIRMNYKSFNDILSSIYQYIEDYITIYDLNKTSISKNYKKIKKVNYQNYIPSTNNRLNVKKIEIPNEYINETSFSKEIDYLITKDTTKNMELGKYIHYLLEMIDFKNTNMDDLNIDRFYKDKIRAFLNNDLMRNIDNAKIYKEYEFMYEENAELYHGIIDLMLEYDDHIDIIDYKLKNIDDVNYLKQLKGYQTYISNLTKKKTNIYLYSILNNKIEYID